MDFKGLSPEQALQAASKDLGLPDNFFDKMWKQESGRGTNMRSPAGARGHFQIMPKTQANLERDELKRPTDPDDFYDGLALAHAAMRQNLSRFKDPVLATAAYNGGWEAGRWDNPETRGYIKSLWGDDAVQKITGKKNAGLVEARAAVTAQVPDTPNTIQAAPFATLPTNKSLDEQTNALIDAQARRDNSTVLGLMEDKYGDSRESGVIAIMDALNRPKAEPGFDYWADREEYEKGLTWGEVQFLRENGTSTRGVEWARNEVMRRRELDARYGDAPGWKDFTASLAVGITDPTAVAAGIGAFKVMKLVGMGAASLAAAGRPGAAVLAAGAEGAAGNLAWEAMQDALGQTKTTADYAMAAGFGAGLGHLAGAVEVRGVNRRAAEQALVDEVNGLVDRAVGRQADEVAAGRSQRDVAAQEQADIHHVVRENSTVVAATDNPNVVMPNDLANEVRAADGDAPVGAINEPAEVVPTRDTPPAEPPAPAPEPAPQEPGTPVEPPPPAPLGVKGTKMVRDVEGTWHRVLFEDGTEGKIVRLNSTESQGVPGWHDLDAKENSFLADTKAEAAKVLAERRAQRAAKVEGPEAPPLRADEALDLLLKAPVLNAQPSLRIFANQLLATARKVLGKVSTELDPSRQRGVYDGTFNRISNPAPGTARGDIAKLDAHQAATLVHESTHAVTARAIDAVRMGEGTPAMRAAVKELDELLENFRAELKAQGRGEDTRGAGYAAKNLDEFVAQVFSDADTRRVLAGMKGKGYEADNALTKFIQVVFNMVMGKGAARDSALSDALIQIDVLIRSGGDLPPGAFFDLKGPTLAGPSPQSRSATTVSFGQRLYAHAQGWLAANPFDQKRLDVLAARAEKGGVVRDYLLSDGLKMASSANPVVRMMAGLLVETTTGVAGRRSTAAAKKDMLWNKILGNTLVDYEDAYTSYRSRNNGGIANDLFKGDVRRKFHTEVAVEILNRRYGNPGTTDASVRSAADSLQGLYQRSLDTQKAASTLGSGYLPPDAVGYMPQALRGEALGLATPKELADLGAHLSKHWQAVYGWSRDFSDTFSDYYLRRAARRANGQRGVDFVALESPTAAVRDTLEEMRLEMRSLNSKAQAELDRVGAQPQNKKRLDVDLLAMLPNGKRVLDYYETDMLTAARQHGNRVAGASALAEFNVLGQRGVNNIMAAIFDAPPEFRASADEVAATERVFSEFLGVPWHGERRIASLSTLSSLTRLQRMGGMGFTQAAEVLNVIHHLGFTTALKNVASLPRMLGEVNRIRKGQATNNYWLSDVEKKMGFEYGLEPFRVHAWMDPPDELLRQYAKGSGVLERLLAAGNFVQGKASFFRATLAAQHRAVAESIIKRAAGYIKDGGDANAAKLRDMGFTDDLVAELRADIDKALGPNFFDVGAFSNVRAQHDFLQAVHRGTKQIIQDTFIGERGAWAHDDLAKTLLQFRTFSLTAMEKQWSRTRQIDGAAAAAGHLLAQWALVTPIYLARAQVYSLGREDREEYLKKITQPANMVVGMLNYTALGGFSGDVLEQLMGVAGGWSDTAADAVGARRSGGVGALVPVLGSGDAALRVLRGEADVHTALKQLPLSNLPQVAPILNLVK